MKSFNFHRFFNVARWDLTVNSQFYTRSALLMLAATCMPVVLYYLFGMLTNNPLYLEVNKADNLGGFVGTIALIGCAYLIISSGYMFHNLLTRQGRINELTLPSTNLERFLWHFVVIVLGVQVVYACGVVLADLLHVLFRLAIPGAEIRSLSYQLLLNSWSEIPSFSDDSHIDFGITLFIYIMTCCFVRSFCLANAWKYRYNIPWTFFIYFLLHTFVPLIILFVIGQFISYERVENFLNWISETSPMSWIVGANIVAVLLYIGIWLLAYRLYKRAQLTTKRNP